MRAIATRAYDSARRPGALRILRTILYAARARMQPSRCAASQAGAPSRECIRENASRLFIGGPPKQGLARVLEERVLLHDVRNDSLATASPGVPRG